MAIYLVVIAAAFLVVSRSVSLIVEEFLIEQRTREGLTEVERMALSVAPYLATRDADNLYSYSRERARALSGRVLVLDRDAVVQIDSASELNGYSLPFKEVRAILLDKQKSFLALHSIPSQTNAQNEFNLAAADYTLVVYYTAPITDAGETIGVLLFSSSIQEVAERVLDVEKQVSVVFVAVIAVVALISFLLSGWLTRPIARLTHALRRMGQQGYGEKVNIHGSSEIAGMGEVFNRMSEKLQTHDKMRDEFVSNASHELKTPLASMKILVESMLYEENADPAIIKEFLGDINSEIDRLNGIIEDLLVVVREDSEQVSFHPQKLQFNELVARVADRLKPISLSNNISLTQTLPPLTIDGDPQRLEQIVSNLVDNAIKYTPAGGKIELTLSHDASMAELSIKDTGVGIKAEHIPYLFDRFFRVDKSRVREIYSSTGLGLSIVDKFVRMHNGYIEVKSEEGKGSEFIVRLPLTLD